MIEHDVTAKHKKQSASVTVVAMVKPTRLKILMMNPLFLRIVFAVLGVDRNSYHVSLEGFLNFIFIYLFL